MAGIITIVGEIAASAEEQATALNQVNTAINQMDQVTQQNAAMVEETTAAAQSLAGDAQELSQLVRRFEIGETAASTTRAEHVTATLTALRSSAQGRAGGGALNWSTNSRPDLERLERKPVPPWMWLANRQACGD